MNPIENGLSDYLVKNMSLLPEIDGAYLKTLRELGDLKVTSVSRSTGIAVQTIYCIENGTNSRYQTIRLLWNHYREVLKNRKESHKWLMQ